MTLSWPQTIAIMMLAMEVGSGLTLRSRAPLLYNGWCRISDACIWSALLYWGGFFTH